MGHIYYQEKTLYVWACVCMCESVNGIAGERYSIGLMSTYLFIDKSLFRVEVAHLRFPGI
jgi:hypothetical protein